MGNPTKLLLLSFVTIVRLNIINCHQDYRWANPSGEGGDLREYEFFHRDVSQTNSISSYTTHDQNYWNSPAQSSNLSNLDLSLGLPGQSSAEHTENVNRVDQSSSSSAYVSHPGHAYNYPQSYTHNPPVQPDRQHYNNYNLVYSSNNSPRPHPEINMGQYPQGVNFEERYFDIIASINYPLSTSSNNEAYADIMRSAIHKSNFKISIEPTNSALCFIQMKSRIPEANQKQERKQETKFVARLASQQMAFLLSVYPEANEVLENEVIIMLDWVHVHLQQSEGISQEIRQHFDLEKEEARTFERPSLELVKKFKNREARLILKILQFYFQSKNPEKWRTFFPEDAYFSAYYVNFAADSLRKSAFEVAKSRWAGCKIIDSLPWTLAAQDMKIINSLPYTNVPEDMIRTLPVASMQPNSLKLFNLDSRIPNFSVKEYAFNRWIAVDQRFKDYQERRKVEKHKRIYGSRPGGSPT